MAETTPAARPSDQIRSGSKLAISLVGFIAVIIAANFLTARFGLVGIGFGLMVTAGTFAAGAALLLRDAVQNFGNKWWVLGAILIGALLSGITASPQIALASGIAFLVSELVDWAVFTPLRSKSLAAAVLVSSVVSAPVDTVVFLWLAGFELSWQAVLGQFIVKTAMAGLAAVVIEVRTRRTSIIRKMP